MQKRNMPGTTVDILLSTFNGEQHLAEQLESLLKQDFTGWKLIVRDDASGDGTFGILRQYADRFPGKIDLSDDRAKLGFSSSFAELLKRSSAEYVMFCDQDDSWNSDKISTLLALIRREEKKLPGIPHLVFSDLSLMDENGESIRGSFLALTGYEEKYGQEQFFLRNYVPGCSLLFNRALAEKALAVPDHLGYHDHRVIFTCAATGKITYCDRALMHYRLHGKNAIGLSERKSESFSVGFKTLVKFIFANRAYRNVRYGANLRQMKETGDRFANELTEPALRLYKWEDAGYLRRKRWNLSAPFVHEKTLTERLVYFFCF
ncbi:MAG TPA: glycosyltransferase family 2 protein [Bacteroidia bacterium]|nr:glycosyltransferase family 2 protein [Bacteroidia bacterium]